MRPLKFLMSGLLVSALIAGGVFQPVPACSREKPGRLSPATRCAMVKAQEALSQEKYDKARQILSSYLKDHAREAPADIYWLLGNSWFLKDKPARACEIYRRGLECFPDNQSLHQNYAVASYVRKDFRTAGDYFVKAFELEKENPDAGLLYKAGSAYYNAGSYGRAKETLKRLISMEEKVRPEWRKLLVYTNISLKDWDSAESALEPLLNNNPASSDYWKLLAKLHLNRDKYRDAAAALSIAYEINPPGKASAWAELADMYFYLNAPLKAGRCLVRGYGEDLSLEQLDRLAHAYGRALRYEKAIEYINKAIAIEPAPERYRTRAVYYYRDRQFSDALASFRKVVENKPEDDWAHLMMGFCAMELDNLELAQKAFSGAAGSEKFGTWARSALAMVDDLIDAKKAVLRTEGIKVSMK